jgi:hypothetical protein
LASFAEDRAMTNIPTCVACGVKRCSIYIEPANDLFDFRSYQCPKCEIVVKVVKPHEARSEFNSVERLALRLPFGFLQKHPLRLQLRTFLDLGLDQSRSRFRWAYFEGRTH